MKWITDKIETSIWRKFRNTLVTGIFLIIWMLSVSMFITGSSIEDYIVPEYGRVNLIDKFIRLCLVAPLIEELVFRYAPIRIAQLAGKQYVIPTILIISFIFGVLHSSSPSPLLMQGFGGFILSCLYIKNNNSYWSSVTVHFMWNFFFYTLAFLV